MDTNILNETKFIKFYFSVKYKISYLIFNKYGIKVFEFANQILMLILILLIRS